MSNPARRIIGYCFWAILCAFPTSAGWAGPETGRLEGTVRSYEDGQPLPGANVVLLETVLGAAADKNGFFFLDDVPAGRYRLKITRIGYAPGTDDVVIRAGETSTVNAILRETTIPMSEVVVSAGKVEQVLAETPGSVSVLDAGALERRAAASLESVLPLVSGVDMRFGQIGIRGSTGFNRGAGSRVLMLVDGFPAVTGDTGGINWDLLPLWEIDRVEIMKGAGSALYGSNALGGVINVITRAPSRRPWTRVALHAGWFSEPFYPEWRWTSRRQGFSGADAVHSRQVGRTRILLSLGERQSEGYRQNNEERRLRSMGRIETDLTPRLKAEVFYSAGRMTYGYFQEWWSQSRALHVRPEARGDRVRSDKMNLAGKMSWAPSERTVLVVKPAWYRTRWKDFFHDGDQFSNADRLDLETRLHASLGERHMLVSGVEQGLGILESSLFGDRRSTTLGGFAQDEIRIAPGLRATAGLRWDGYWIRDGLREDRWSPKLAALWQPAPTWSLRMSLSRGFRAPSLAERFTRATVGGITIEPNPELHAESVWSGEVGMLTAVGRSGTLSAAFFENRYDNLIQAEGDLDEFRFVNTERVRVRGLDVDLELRLRAGLSGRLAYCLQDAVDRETGGRLPYRPRHSLAAFLDFQTHGMGLGGDFRYESKVDSVVAYPEDERVPLYLVNVRSSLNMGGATLSFVVDNLLQYHFLPIERNLAPIRSYTLTLMADL